MYNGIIGMNRKCMEMLSIGMDLTIEADKSGIAKKFKSKVADLHEQKLFIYYPLSIADNKPVFLPVGSKVMVNFTCENSDVYSFESEVMGLQKNTVPLLELFLPEEKFFSRVQRREYVRVYAAVRATLDFPESSQKFTSVTSDISAGGCAVTLPPDTEIEPGESGTIGLSLQMESGEQFQLTLLCKVIRIFQKNKIDLISLKYIEPSHADQQLLTRFCFEKQLSDRKKGLRN
ncbi:MAG TPA: pilus assembly protein PilZ [Bacillus bacterium]|uniref:flagellar brake protein n=1 Tax=Siminovitchia fordii TaxID=254759 RepID=UPI000A023DDF|nr:PilZ domain-containing protein [Siminovitchia fordii]HBZ09419.1 pilus assembly protein PilZ [Bacillus sp. (in: firmicutes)]